MQIIQFDERSIYLFCLKSLISRNNLRFDNYYNLHTLLSIPSSESKLSAALNFY